MDLGGYTGYEPHCTVGLVTKAPPFCSCRHGYFDFRNPNYEFPENQREIISFGAYTGYEHHCIYKSDLGRLQANVNGKTQHIYDINPILNAQP